jgi:riboflavin kinase/FMN adenylyltransferase
MRTNVPWIAPNVPLNPGPFWDRSFVSFFGGVEVLMIIYHQAEEIASKISGSCVTIGNFDGVHLGHRTLLEKTVSQAKTLGLSSVAVTFEPHPLRLFTGNSNPPLITLLDQKLELLGGMDLDYTLCLEFNHELAALSPENFVATYLVETLKTRKLIIGYDYAFGKGRAGNYELLSRLGRVYGFEVEQLDPVLVGGVIVSSTRIRDLIESGQVWEARPLLGRFYRVAGRVIHGMKRGGPMLGFPTANIHLTDELFPKTGVYAVWAEIQKRILPAVANIGFNPTFGNDVLSVEVHIMDFKGDLYDQDILVHFVQRLRSEKKFSGLDELKAQIARDKKIARTILASPEAIPA